MYSLELEYVRKPYALGIIIVEVHVLEALNYVQSVKFETKQLQF